MAIVKVKLKTKYEIIIEGDRRPWATVDDLDEATKLAEALAYPDGDVIIVNEGGKVKQHCGRRFAHDAHGDCPGHAYDRT